MPLTVTFRSERSGLSLIEVLIAALLLSVGVLAMGASTGYVMNQIQVSELRSERMADARQAAESLGGVYETLIVQERTYAAGGTGIHGQEPTRTALGILESELRVLGAMGDSAIGGTDFLVAAVDSVVFRAQRKIGFVCSLSRDEKSLATWVLGDFFEGGDSVLLFVDNDSLEVDDDDWDPAVLSSAGSHTDAACSGDWDQPLQLLTVTDHDMVGVTAGAPIRSYQWVTYGLYRFGHGWGLGRRVADGPPRLLVGGLAPPGAGLSFTYYTPDGSETDDPTQIARLMIEVRTDSPVTGDIRPRSLTTTLYLRNN